MSSPAYIEKFVAFVDVLGFKNLVAQSERNTGLPLSEILDVLAKLGDGTEREHFASRGPSCCPEAPRQAKNLDFRVTQISDCVIVSAEISPAGVINLVSHCWGAVMALLARGLMCRGYIKKGKIFHTKTQVLGTGYQDAYAAESGVSAFRREADERGIPYVEVDSEVAAYVDGQSDKCVKEMFGRMTGTDGDTVVLFPFKRLQHSFIIAGLGISFDPEKELIANNNLRSNIHRYKEKIWSFVDLVNPSAVSKANHYIGALDAQLVACDQTEQAIRDLTLPFGRPRR